MHILCFKVPRCSKLIYSKVIGAKCLCCGESGSKVAAEVNPVMRFGAG